MKLNAILTNGKMVLVLSIRNVFVRIKNYILPPKYMRCGTCVQKQNSLLALLDRTSSFRFDCKKRY